MNKDQDEDQEQDPWTAAGGGQVVQTKGTHVPKHLKPPDTIPNPIPDPWTEDCDDRVNK
ncbi:GM18789 [Drosophila sechellia]|uniref:GM18789 n=1 Tax=Drosophila sechellia TaxID=7238 RepID=B4IM15_DROSE|nr:GM18789 [Drosophila sechellia]